MPLKAIASGASVVGIGRFWFEGSPVFAPDWLDPGEGCVAVEPRSMAAALDAAEVTPGGGASTNCVQATGVWQDGQLTVTEVVSSPGAEGSWAHPLPVYSGPDAGRVGGWRRWTHEQASLAWADLNPEERQRLVSLKPVPTPDGGKAWVAVADEKDLKWAQERLEPLFQDSLVVLRSPWSVKAFDDADQHITTNLELYEVMLQGVRLRGNGLSEIYVQVACLTAQLQSWASQQPREMLHIVPWFMHQRVHCSG
jgi:hypothetical protein